MIRSWKKKGVKGLAILLVLIPLVACTGMHRVWNSSAEKTMYKHYLMHENDLRELVRYAESLTDSVSLVFPSDSIPPEVSEEQYEHVIELLRRTQCKGVETYVWGNNTMVIFSKIGFGSCGYLSFPDNTIKVYRWDPLGSDSNGIYDIDTPPFNRSVILPR